MGFFARHAEATRLLSTHMRLEMPGGFQCCGVMLYDKHHQIKQSHKDTAVSSLQTPTLELYNCTKISVFTTLATSSGEIFSPKLNARENLQSLVLVLEKEKKSLKNDTKVMQLISLKSTDSLGNCFSYCFTTLWDPVFQMSVQVSSMIIQIPVLCLYEESTRAVYLHRCKTRHELEERR